MSSEGRQYQVDTENEGEEPKTINLLTAGGLIHLFSKHLLSAV